MTHLTEQDLVLLYYGEPGAPADGRAHLRECVACRAAAASLARTLNICSEWTLPEPAPDFGRSVWAGIAPRLEDRPARLWLPLRWLVPALCALLLGAFLVGRISNRPAPALTAGLSDQARQRILAITLADHLDRAELLLTEISNTSADDTGADFSSARFRAQDLVDEGRLILQTISGARGETATSSLLDQVDRFMLEVANAPDRVSPEEIQTLQRRIRSGSLLFKVRIIQSNLRTEGQKS
ncbi:MAG: hypothetical protein ABUS49_04625 [Acidobacteriota bacterium]